MTIAVTAMQGLTILCVLASAWLAWRVAMSAHDKIDWLKEDMDDRESAMSMIVNGMSQRVDALSAQVERLSAKLQERTLDAARVRMKKIGGAK
jgi:hypothetical protein